MTIPLTSNLFQASQALKKVNGTPTAQPPPSSTHGMPAVTHPQPYPMYGYPPPFFPQMGPLMPWPNQHQIGGQNMPSSPPPEDTGSLEDFYDQFRVAEDVREGLERLGFQIGDDLSKVSSEEVKDVGIKLLDWQRLLKHYRKYKHQNK
jgi:hypothetical protein